MAWRQLKATTRDTEVAHLFGPHLPIVSEVCQSGPWGRDVDGRPWWAAGMDFWNKRHEFLTPIVSEVCQSGPRGRAVDGRPWRAAGMDFWNEWHSFPRRLFQKSVRAGRGRTAVTGCWDENKWHGFLATIVSKVFQSGPWYSRLWTSPDLNLTPLAAFLRFLPSAAALGKNVKKSSKRCQI